MSIGLRRDGLNRKRISDWPSLSSRDTRSESLPRIGYGWQQGDTLYIGVRAHTIISHRMEYELSKSAVYLPRKYQTGITFVRR